MAFFDSQVSVFKLDDAEGNERDLSPYLIEVSGLPGSRALDDVTGLGDAGSRFAPGIEGATIYLAGLYDSEAGSGADAVLGPLRTHDSATVFAYGPPAALCQTYDLDSRDWCELAVC